MSTVLYYPTLTEGLVWLQASDEYWERRFLALHRAALERATSDDDTDAPPAADGGTT